MTATATLERSTVHSTFVIERRYKQPPARVFAAFAKAEAKRRWFVEGEGFTTDEYALDFRVGGREIWRGKHRGSVEVRNETVYRDIVPDRRVICCYDMYVGGNRISVSLLTLEFAAGEAGGTLLKLTEQDAFLDGYDDRLSREGGTRALLDALEAYLGHAA